MKYKDLLKLLIKYLIFIINPIISTVGLVILTIEMILKKRKSIMLENLLLITTLSLKNNIFFKLPESYEKIKFLLIGILFIKAISKTKDKIREYKIRNFIKFENIYIIWLGFILYFGIVSLYFSSFPKISLSKLFYYFMGHTICYLLIKDLRIKILNKKIFEYLCTMLILNIFVAIMQLGYVRTPIGFQGIYGNPNSLGIILVTFYACLLAMYKSYLKRILSIEKFVFLNIIIFIFLKLTNSRTSLITAFICLIYFICIVYKDTLKKIVLMYIIGIIIAIGGFFFKDSINKTLYKGNSNILYSRQKLIDRNLERFKMNPFFGKGFAVEEEKKENGSLAIEKGNTILQILSDGGIFGIVYFVFICGYLFKKSSDAKRIIFLSVILTNMGEATLLAFNGVGAFNVLMLYYIVKKERNSKLRMENMKK